MKLNIKFSKTQNLKSVFATEMNLEDTKPRIGPPLLRGRGEPKPPPRGEKFYDFGLFFSIFCLFLPSWRATRGGERRARAARLTRTPGSSLAPPCRPSLFPLWCSVFCVSLSYFSIEVSVLRISNFEASRCVVSFKLGSQSNSHCKATTDP